MATISLSDTSGGARISGTVIVSVREEILLVTRAPTPAERKKDPKFPLKVILLGTLLAAALGMVCGQGKPEQNPH